MNETAAPSAQLTVGSGFAGVPAELWDIIFARACTDGGRTGCALSLTSKYIRAVSLPHKHRSVALYGNARIMAFAWVVGSAECPLELRRVMNLFVHVDVRAFSPGEDSDKENSGRDGWSPESEEPEDLDAEALPIIFEATAPTLSHLTFLSSQLYNMAKRSRDQATRVYRANPVASRMRLEWFLRTPLQHLTDLTLGDVAADEKIAWMHFTPAVRRLHVDNPDIAPCLLLQTPQLSHLRLTDPDASFRFRGVGDKLLRGIAQLYSSDQRAETVQDGNCPSLKPLERALARMESIIIQLTPCYLPAPVVSDGSSGSLLRPQNMIRYQYQNVSRTVRSIGANVPVVRVIEEYGANFDVGASWATQWLDRNCGGEGCWVEDPARD